MTVNILKARKERTRQQKLDAQRIAFIEYTHRVMDDYSKRCKEEGLVFGKEF
jgi:hypothetical protein